MDGDFEGEITVALERVSLVQRPFTSTLKRAGVGAWGRLEARTWGKETISKPSM